MGRYRHFTGILPNTYNISELDNITTIRYYKGQDIKNGIKIIIGFHEAKTITAVFKIIKEKTLQPCKDIQGELERVTCDEERTGKIYMYGKQPSLNRDNYNTTIREALQEKNQEEALKTIEEKDAYFYMTHKKQLMNYMEEKYHKGDQGSYKPEQFNRPMETDFTKTIVFVGPTGLGKTQYALAHFTEPLHVRDKCDYSRYNTKTDGIVMDDLSTHQWNPLTFLKLIEIETAVTQDVKYGMARIRAGCPRIICCNSEELLWPDKITSETKAACDRRLKIIHITTPLYDNNKRKMTTNDTNTIKKPKIDINYIKQILEHQTRLTSTDITNCDIQITYSTEDEPPEDCEILYTSYANDKSLIIYHVNGSYNQNNEYKYDIIVHINMKSSPKLNHSC